MGTAREITETLKRDGYDISTRNDVIMALQEDVDYSEEEAVSVAGEIIKESQEIKRYAHEKRVVCQRPEQNR